MDWDLIVTPCVAHVLLPTQGDQSLQSDETTQLTGTSGERERDGVGDEEILAAAVAESVSVWEAARVPDGVEEGEKLTETLLLGDSE